MHAHLPLPLLFVGQGRPECRSGPGSPLLPVCSRYAEQLAHHTCGKWYGECLDQVRLATEPERVDELTGDCLDSGLELPDASGREGIGHERSQASVVRRIT